jgi:uncharacterized membrane protein YhaH (DUF805 family)
MDLRFLFTSFQGRIGRQQWWIGSIILLAAAIILYFLVMPFLGMHMIPTIDPAASPDAMIGLMRRMAIGQAVLTAILAYPVTALMKKRLNDRDRPDWLIYVFWAPTVIGLLLGLTGLGYTVTDMGAMTMPSPTALNMVVSLAGFAIGLWALVELGFFKGTAGPNQHGPDPLAA